jgi:hypothetical protein
MSAQAEASIEQLVFRKTHEHTGPRISITPRNSSTRHWSYGRSMLDSSKSTESIAENVKAARRVAGLTFFLTPRQTGQVASTRTR